MLRIAGLLLAALICLASPGRASDADWEACNQATDLDRKITGCSAILTRGARESDHDRAVAFDNRGLAYVYKGQLDRAKADFNEAIRLDPKWEKAFYDRSNVFNMRGDSEGAITNLNEAIRLEPDFAQAFAFRGNVYQLKGDDDRAIADCNEAIRLQPQNLQALSVRSGSYIHKGDFDGAIGDLSEMLRQRPDDEISFLSRGVAYENKGDYDRAIADYSEAIRLKSGYQQAYLDRGNAYYNKNDYDRAIDDYNEVIRLNPDFAGAFLMRGLAYEGKGNYDLAIADHSEAIRLKPNFAEAMNGRGYAFALKGDYDRAIVDLNEAIRLKPGDANFLDSRGYAYFGKGDLGDALTDIDEALRLNPMLAESYTTRGRIFEQRGDLQKALADFDEALVLKSDLAEAKKGRERVRSALLPALSSTPLSPARKPATPNRRIALIIANGAYKVGPLANPIVDAGIVRESLAKIGFDVTVKTDLDLDRFEEAIADFAESSKGADVALFYFAGHGFSLALGGAQRNFLMTTGANFSAATALGLQQGGEPLDHVEEIIVGHARATLIFVDACRNVPVLAHRSMGGRGFVPLDPISSGGVYVVLSARQGTTANDGVAGNGSPFARAFASGLSTPGLRIEDFYRRLRDQVKAETSGEQIPDEVQDDLPEGGLTLVSAGP